MQATQLFKDYRLAPLVEWFDAAVSAHSSSPGKVGPSETVQGVLVLRTILGREPAQQQGRIKAAAMADLRELARRGALDASDVRAFQRAQPLFMGPASQIRGILTAMVLGESVPSAYQSSVYATEDSVGQTVQCLMHNFVPGQEQVSLREIEQALGLVERHGEAVHGPGAANVAAALLTMHTFLRDRIQTSGTGQRSLDDVIYRADRWGYRDREGQRVAREPMSDALHHIGLALRGIEHAKITPAEAFALLKFLGDRIFGANGDTRDGLTKLKEAAYTDGSFEQSKRELRRDIRKVEGDLTPRRSIGGRLV